MASFSPRIWNTTAHEREAPFPCDGEVSRCDDAWYRAIDIAAPPERIFAWLCQLRVAPYSYDWIDNLGRKSPPVLTPGLTALSGGERFMFVFALTGFVPCREITLRLANKRLPPRFFGECSITYRITSGTGQPNRLVVKLTLRYPAGPIGWLARHLLPTGDLIMMRKQLFTLKKLAEAA